MPGAGVAVVTAAVAATSVTVTATGLAFGFSMATFAISAIGSLALGAISGAIGSKPKSLGGGFGRRDVVRKRSAVQNVNDSPGGNVA